MMVERYEFRKGIGCSSNDLEKSLSGSLVTWDDYAHLEQLFKQQFSQLQYTEKELWELEVEWRAKAQEGSYDEGFADGVEEGWNRAEHAWR